jgi:mono/diheme cytochrome c family protein
MAALGVTAGGDEQGERAAPRPAATATTGKVTGGRAVWVAQGCGSCHRFAPAGSTAVFGPDLGMTLRGVTASYIRTSIVAPAAATAPGYSTGMMPEDYRGRMTRAELDSLVAFIARNVR